ncbi:MAG TPA: hypothetical protein VH518_19425 [Tepidisphaeraceae bacterium]|jgi:hypothetical protein
MSTDKDQMPLSYPSAPTTRARVSKLRVGGAFVGGIVLGVVVMVVAAGVISSFFPDHVPRGTVRALGVAMAGAGVVLGVTRRPVWAALLLGAAGTVIFFGTLSWQFGNQSWHPYP